MIMKSIVALSLVVSLAAFSGPVASQEQHIGKPVSAAFQNDLADCQELAVTRAQHIIDRVTAVQTSAQHGSCRTRLEHDTLEAEI